MYGAVRPRLRNEGVRNAPRSCRSRVTARITPSRWPRLAFKPDPEDVGHHLEAVGIVAEIALIVHLNTAVDLFTGQASERADLALAT